MGTRSGEGDALGLAAPAASLEPAAVRVPAAADLKTDLAAAKDAIFSFFFFFHCYAFLGVLGI